VTGIPIAVAGAANGLARELTAEKYAARTARAELAALAAELARVQADLASVQRALAPAGGGIVAPGGKRTRDER
jgi:hypothetical protein